MLKNFKNSLKNLLGDSNQNTSPNPQNDGSNATTEQKNTGLINDLKKSFGFVGDAYNTVRGEFTVAREKSKDLRRSNYDIGLKHLEKGDISEAVFRFRLTKKFWPDFFDAHYQLAYCLALSNKLNQAKTVLEELLQKNPDFDPKARDLLDQIKSKLK